MQQEYVQKRVRVVHASYIIDICANHNLAMLNCIAYSLEYRYTFLSTNVIHVWRHWHLVFFQVQFLPQLYFDLCILLIEQDINGDGKTLAFHGNLRQIYIILKSVSDYMICLDLINRHGFIGTRGKGGIVSRYLKYIRTCYLPVN